jgi:hypothetical protein
LTGTADENLQVFEELPKDREHEPLQAVCYNTGFQTTTEQADQAVGSNYRPSGVEIPDAGFVNLPVRLDHAEGVRNGVGGNGRAESDECSAKEFLE